MEMGRERTLRSNTGDVVLFDDTPLAWIISTIFILVGSLFVVLPFVAENRNETGIGAQLVSVGMGLMAVIVGYVLFKTSHRCRVTLDRRRSALRFEKIGLKSRSIEEHELATIDKAEVSQRRDSEGDSVYGVDLVLRGGTRFSLAASSAYSKQWAQERVDLINEAIFHGGSGIKKMLDQRAEARRTPPAVVGIILAVIALPFASFAAASIAPSQAIVQTGPPDQMTASRLEGLLPGGNTNREIILWAGQPEPGREMLTKIWFVPFAIVWTLFTLFWISAACGFEKPSLRNAGRLLFALFGVPFALIGFGMLLTPYFSYRTDQQTVYIVTDKRAIVYNGKRAYTLVEAGSDRLAPPIINAYATDKADVLFVRDSEHGHRAIGGFFGVKHPNLLKEVLSTWTQTGQTTFGRALK
jgi:hypothetical protein